MLLLTPVLMHPWMNFCVTYADDEHVDNHDYDDNTDGDHDNNNDICAHACNARVNTSLNINGVQEPGA